MPILRVHHVTTYRYRQPVQFGEHRIMFRPRESYDQRLLSTRLDVEPRPSRVRWVHDVFGNCVTLVQFQGRATDLRFESTVVLDHSQHEAVDFETSEHASTYPFAYDAQEQPDLSRSMERQHPDPNYQLDRWARRFVRSDGMTDTHELLANMTHAIRREFTYVARPEKGTQTPLQTLRLGRGTCRDFAVLMIEAARSLGFAARFVSGYIYSPGRDPGRDLGRDDGRAYVGGGSTHAWVRIYVPGAGWTEFDPTNGIVGNRDLIRVAIVRDPAQAVPLSGTWTGFPADFIDMQVDVSVTAERNLPVAAPAPEAPTAEPARRGLPAPAL